jgi:hypothetical protein
MMQRIHKIISGGQTGVDQAALRAAMDLGFHTGGWCPPGRICDNGQIPQEFNLTETKKERSEFAPDIPRSLRTESNVIDADASLILVPEGTKSDKGTEWTIDCARKYSRPFLVIDPYRPDADQLILNWMAKISAGILNISGPSEKTSPGIYNSVYRLLLKVFSETGISQFKQIR